MGNAEKATNFGKWLKGKGKFIKEERDRKRPNFSDWPHELLGRGWTRISADGQAGLPLADYWRVSGTAEEDHLVDWRIPDVIPIRIEQPHAIYVRAHFGGSAAVPYIRQVHRKF